MWKALDAVCPRCRFLSNSSSWRPTQSIVGQRSYATRRGPRTREQPSRMVLSDRVAEPRSGQRGDGTRRPRKSVDGPFAGMNRTVFKEKEGFSRPARSSRPTGPPSQRRRGATKDRDDAGPRPFKALRMQQTLATISYGRRTHMKDRMQEVESFDQFDLLPSVKAALADIVLKGMVDIKPTPVQRLAVPALLGQKTAGQRQKEPRPEREEFLLAAETGSGKTLAYLLPCINAIKTAEAEDADIQAYNKRFMEEKERREKDPRLAARPFEPHPTTSRPRMVILVPTAELVDQVAAVAKSLSHLVKFKARMLSAKYSAAVIQSDLYNQRGVDVLIATPHLLASVAESEPNILSKVTHLVVDEADSLLDRSFSAETTKIIDRAGPSLKQLVLCSATIPKRLDSYLTARFPDIRRITTPNLHAIPRRVQLGVIDVARDPYRNNKNLACADAVWSIGKEAARHEGPDRGEVDVRRIMVFVNERETTQAVADYLVSKGIDAVALHRDTPEQRQSEALASFTSGDPLRARVDALTEGTATTGGASKPGLGKRSLPNTKVIVATDLASRGIDTLAVRHVVLYDVPHSTIDFIHRLGRAGRMGRRGRGVVLLGKDDRKDVVAEVRQSMFMGQALV